MVFVESFVAKSKWLSSERIPSQLLCTKKPNLQVGDDEVCKMRSSHSSTPLPFVVESRFGCYPLISSRCLSPSPGVHQWWGHVPGAAMRAELGPLRRAQVTLQRRR